MKALFLTVLEISLSTSVIVLLLLLSSRVLNRRYAAKWKYGIWILLALRLAVPLKLSLPQKQILLDVPAGLTVPIAAAPVAPVVTETLTAAPSVAPLDILALVWLAGAALFLGVHLLSYFHYRRSVLKRNARVTDINVLRQVRSITQELDIRVRLPILLDENIGSPMVIGFFRPILVMPDMEYRPTELYFVLKHELVHLKRHDIFSKFLFVAANAIHWFNPIMYLMQKEAVVDMELSCDERVVKDTVYETRKAYTETLLSTLTRNYRKSTALSTQFFGDKAVMKKRFRNILTRARKRNGIVILVVIMALAIGLGAVIGVSAGEQEMEEAQRMLQVANDFKDAYVAGDRETMKQYMADTYQGDLDIQPITDLDYGRGVNLYGDPQPGDLSLNLDVFPNVTSTNAPIGSTFTALSRSQSKEAPVDALRFSFIKQEDGWKIRSYELVNYPGYSDSYGMVGEAAAATEVQATMVSGAEPADDLAGTEGEKLSAAAAEFANAYFQGNTEKLGLLIAEDFVGNASPYAGPSVDVSGGSMKFAPQLGDIGATREDEISIYNESVPVRSSMTVLLELGDHNFYMIMVKEETGWKVYDFRLERAYSGLDDYALEIAKLAEDFTYAYFASDPDVVASYLTTPHSKYSEPAVSSEPFLGIHAIKGIPEYKNPPKVGARAAISVEFKYVGDDSYSYLSMELAKKEDGWKVYSYMIEK